ncbi:guanylate cyclase domain-containing protein [Haematococcus lacustris]|uniref:Guanylate cyclase domain-containing protein n=1 Tax=Haematococcus lacustris TaxID=44745 RepID=A0A699Z2M7_HAELA|nr:guanylate cyclase domain-containing protein [Haematococcus lacustris]
MLGSLAASGALTDLQSSIDNDENQVVAWSDMPPYITARGSNFGKQVVGIPLVESVFIMYVNWPLLTSVYNISRPVLGEAGRLSFYPDTWQELAAMMRQVNATASDPVTGRPRHALCIPVATDSSVVMYAVMASIMQTDGTTQGWLYDPLTLEPLTNNTAMLKASLCLQVLRTMWELSPFMRSFDSAITIDMGECAIALADSSVFKSLHIMYYNRNLMGLGGQLVNLAPSRYKAAQLIGLTHQVPQQLRKAVYDFIAFMGSPNVTQSYLRTPYSLDAPFRASALLVYKPGDPLAEPGAAAWKGMGYNYADVQSYAHALSSILALPYTAMDFRVADELKPLSYTQSALLALIGCSNPLVPRSAGSPADFAAAMTSMTSGLRALPRSLMGHVLPPAAGDKATLVITDVQGSSKLWELLPAGVMEASMKLHDELTRRLAVIHLGYEWATEGDSFLLCFHTPEAAVTFATQLQVGSE